jgi:hypothetical protein
MNRAATTSTHSHGFSFPSLLKPNDAGIPIFLSILLRYLRITPLLAFIVGLYATLMKHMSSGPLWFR